MPRYQLKNKILFVDAASEHDHNKKKPDTIKAAHVLDQSGGGKKILKLDDTAGFIARFIVQGVETDNLLPEILKSEYSNIANAQDEVNKVRDMLFPKYVQQLGASTKAYVPVIPPDPEEPYTKEYKLDFSPNWFAIGWIKF
jgi:hypothetical protein